METITVKWTGVRPLLMSNPQTVDILNPYSRRARELNIERKAAAKKADNWDQLEALEKKMARNDWEASAYWSDADKTFFLKFEAVEATIKAGAMKSRRGKDVLSSVSVEHNAGFVPVDTKRKFKSLDEGFADPEFVFVSPVKIPPRTGSLVMKRRCCIPTGWTITFDVLLDETLLSSSALKQAMDDAGALCGIGGWRPKFGRFTSEVLK